MNVAIARLPARALAVTASLLAGLAILVPAGASAEPVGLIEHFPTKCGVGALATGPDGNVWFSCFKENSIYSEGRGRALLGKISPEGKITEYSAGIPADRGIGGIVAGPEGNLWFTLDGASYPPSKGHPSAIGRITPDGVVSLFSTGLRERSAPGEIIAGPGGDLWFADTAYGKVPEIGRVTPQGTITEFTTGLKAPLGLGGLATGPDGNLWFTQVFDLPHGNGELGAPIARLTPDGAVTQFGATPAALGAPLAGPDGNVWFVGDTGKVAIDRVTPAGEISQFGNGLVGVPADLVTGPEGNVWFTAQHSIGRITPSGEITQFTRCLDYRQAFSEASSIIAGPDGDLWFTSVTSRMTPAIAEPPTLGRITPSGEITQFKAGLQGEPRSLLAGPDGKVWFTTGGDQIERITPPTTPVNTFIFGPGEAKADGAATVSVEVPDPGRIELRQLALILPRHRSVRVPATPTAGAVATSCGPTQVKLRLGSAAKTRLRHHGRVELKAQATFTPTGGSANTQVETITLRKARKRR